VVDVFLLLAQEVERDGVEGVGAQLVVAEQDLEQVELHTALHVHHLSNKDTTQPRAPNHAAPNTSKSIILITI